VDRLLRATLLISLSTKDQDRRGAARLVALRSRDFKRAHMPWYKRPDLAVGILVVSTISTSSSGDTLMSLDVRVPMRDVLDCRCGTVPTAGYRIPRSLPKSLWINVNLWWGLVCWMFGLVMLAVWLTEPQANLSQH